MVYPANYLPLRSIYFEVDSTESVWYRDWSMLRQRFAILKLTPQSQYGIS